MNQHLDKHDLTPRESSPPTEGGVVGLMVIALFYFVLGFLLGAWLW